MNVLQPENGLSSPDAASFNQCTSAKRQSTKNKLRMLLFGKTRVLCFGNGLRCVQFNSQLRLLPSRLAVESRHSVIPAPPTNRCKTIELLLFHGRNPFGPSRGFHLLNNICMSLLLFFVVLFLFFVLSAIKKGRKSFADDRDWCSSLDHCYAEEEGDAQLRLSNESDRY